MGVVSHVAVAVVGIMGNGVRGAETKGAVASMAMRFKSY